MILLLSTRFTDFGAKARKHPLAPGATKSKHCYARVLFFNANAGHGPREIADPCPQSGSDPASASAAGGRQCVKPQQPKRVKSETSRRIIAANTITFCTSLRTGGLKLCQFKKLPTTMLKQPDKVYSDIDTVKDCRKKCLHAPYECRSFDLGDGRNKVCRVSYLDPTHVHDSYNHVPGATMYEMDVCFNGNCPLRALLSLSLLFKVA